jgi:hypothetical protein
MKKNVLTEAPPPERNVPTIKQTDTLRQLSRLMQARTNESSDELTSRHLPKTYEIVQAANRENDPNNPFNSHAYQSLLPHVERMAKQGMSLRHIAARLGVALFALQEAVQLFPDVAAALSGGLARGIDEQSESLYAAGIKGDVGASKFYLQTKGDFVPASTAPQVTVNIGDQKASVTTFAIESMADRQRALLEYDGDVEES